MRAILEFNLPEESEEHRIALEGGKYYSATEFVFAWIRSKQKYTDLTEDQNKLLEDLKQELIAELD